MSAFLDTSMLVRYLMHDSPELAKKAANIIDSGELLLVTDVVLMETAYVLTSVYAIPRSIVVDGLVDFLQREKISTFTLDKGFVLQGLLLCRPSRRVSFADAMIWAAARSSGSKVIYSLDERFPSDGLQVKRE